MKDSLSARLPAEKPLHSPMASLPAGVECAGRLPRETGSQCCCHPWDPMGHRAVLTPMPTQTAALLGIPPRLLREAGQE